MKHLSTLGRSALLFLTIPFLVLAFQFSPAQAQQSDAKPIQLIFATYDRQTSDSSVAAQVFMKNITERTKGLVTFRAYYSGAMGSPKEIFPSAASGTIQIGISRTLYSPKFRLTTIDELPYTGYKMDARERAYVQLMEEFPEIKSEFTKANLKFMVPFQSNAPALYSKKRITQPDDFRGVRIRAGGSGAVLVKAWGGTPVNLEIGDVYEAISRGTVEGAFGFPPQTGVSYSLQDICKYLIDTGTGALGMQTMVMNLDAYNKLPASIKTIFDEEAAALIVKYPEIRMDGMRKSIPKVMAAGVEIMVMPEASQDRLAELAKAVVHEDWVKDMVSKGYPEATARKMIERMTTLYKQYALNSSFKEFWDLYQSEFKK